MAVSRIVPRSMQALAPISTSSPMVTAPSEWMRVQLCARISARDPRVSRISSTPDFSGVTKEAVGADHGAGLADEAVADGDARADPRALQDQGIGPDAGASAIDTWLAMRAPAPMVTPRPMVTKGPMAAPAPSTGLGVDNGHGVDARRDIGAGVHQPRQARQRQTRARREDRGLQTHRLPVGTRPQQRRPRPALRDAARVFRVHRQRQIIGTGQRRFGGTGHDQIGHARAFRPKGGGNVGYAVAHGLPLRCGGFRSRV
jgi:hypothetical protein